jgi:hypothetical protein
MSPALRASGARHCDNGQSCSRGNRQHGSFHVRSSIRFDTKYNAQRRSEFGDKTSRLSEHGATQRSNSNEHKMNERKMNAAVLERVDRIDPRSNYFPATSK